ncbi:heparinase II/III family protein, partial [Persicitalea sp.]|uniref:heparinase II/III domain-containing protein n=1 Tax=Persicitalea sp. TaxID=3100273 RepID=UPI003593DF7E
FLSALEKALGTDYGLTQIPGFMQTAGFEQHIVGPLGIVHNWGDSGDKNGVSPTLFWFASKKNDPSLLWMQKKVIDEQPGRDLVKDRTLPALLIWGAGMNLSNIPPPQEKFWMGQGPSPVAMMRSSWTDPNAIFVGFKAGSASVNHAHMDAGSFVLDALGERWAMDFGPQNYNSLEELGIKLFGREQDAERWDIFRYNNLVHNTLTIDGKYQRVKGYAKIDAFSNDPQNMAIVSDLSTVYDGQAVSVKRGIALRDDKYVVVRDEIKAPGVDSPNKDITLRWTLLTPANVFVQDGKTVVLSQRGKTMYLSFDTSTPIKIKTWSTKPTHDYDAPNPNTYMVGFEATLPAGSSHSFNAIFSNTKSLNSSPVKPLSEWKVESTK